MSKKQPQQQPYSQNADKRGDYDHPSPAEKHVTPSDGEAVQESKWPLYITGLIIVGLVASYFKFPGFQQELKEAWDVLTSGEKQRISQWVSQFGFWGPFFIVLAMVAQMFLLVINVVALMLVAILAYGAFWGSVIAIAAVAVASTIGYWIGRGVGEAGISRLIGHKTEKKVMELVDRYGIWAVIIARISPFLSNDAVSFVAGLARMGYFKFIGATLAGITPLTVLLAWLGGNNDRLTTGLIWVSAVSLVAFIGYIIYDRRTNKNKP